MRLATFSAILQFAQDQEKAAGDCFARAVAGPSVKNPELAMRLKVESEKNLKGLQTILRENVTELVMEPYDSLDSEAFQVAPDPADPMASGVLLWKKQQEFLRAAMRVIKMREVVRALEKIAAREQALLEEVR